MLKVILKTPRHIPPFNEPARDLRIQNKPLWLNQRDLLAPYVSHEIELDPGEHLPVLHEPMIVYRDNLFFDEGYITEFMSQAQKRGRAVRAAFPWMMAPSGNMPYLFLFLILLPVTSIMLTCGTFPMDLKQMCLRWLSIRKLVRLAITTSPLTWPPKVEICATRYP